MQRQTNEATQKIANAESDEEAHTRFKGLIKMIRSRSFKYINEKNSETIERLRESGRETDQKEGEDSDEVMETEKTTRNSISDHVKFSMSESDRKRKGRKMSLSNSNRISRAERRVANVCKSVNNENNGNNTNCMLNNYIN